VFKQTASVPSLDQSLPILPGGGECIYLWDEQKANGGVVEQAPFEAMFAFERRVELSPRLISVLDFP
jgi:hypothetical protein